MLLGLVRLNDLRWVRDSVLLVRGRVDLGTGVDLGGRGDGATGVVGGTGFAPDDGMVGLRAVEGGGRTDKGVRWVGNGNGNANWNWDASLAGILIGSGVGGGVLGVAAGGGDYVGLRARVGS